MAGKGAYGAQEARFAGPFAEALRSNSRFRTWLLARTEFHRYAATTTLLDEEMKARRSKAATSWWRSHYRGGCLCAGCRGGQETDLLAVFETANGIRFAIHVEVKQPKDRFPTDRDQAANYSARAQCWIHNPPLSVLPHQRATTMLLCSKEKLPEYTPHLAHFGSVVTFEEISEEFDDIYPDRAVVQAPSR